MGPAPLDWKENGSDLPDLEIVQLQVYYVIRNYAYPIPLVLKQRLSFLQNLIIGMCLGHTGSEVRGVRMHLQ